MAIPRVPQNPSDEADQNPAVAYQREYTNNPQCHNLPLTCRGVAKQKQRADADGQTTAA
jgi:hypothetical protein